MNDHLLTCGCNEYDDLKQVRRPVRSDDEPPVRDFAEVIAQHRVVERMQHLGGRHSLATCRAVDFHMNLPYYENGLL